ncbi:MAG: carbohydrate kinase family protein [Candidatus Eisenbacteria bacterium]|nr:carbohydrate kinase family protein [Candidatus Eisenbacteria bacterium]
MTPDLVLLGNLLVDDVVYADGTTRMGVPGGAMLYSSLAARLWDATTGCASVQGDDYPQTMLDELRARGVLLEGVRKLGRNGIRTWLMYEGDLRRVIHRLGCPSHEEVSPAPDDIPLDWRRARAFHLAPMPMATQLQLVRAIRAWESPESPAFISLDPYILVTPDTLAAWRELLQHVDAFFPSEDEMLLPGAHDDPVGTLAQLAGGKLRYVFSKRGAAGGVVYDTHDQRLHDWPAITPAAELEPTGAGDAFMAGFVTATLEGLPIDAALKRAAVTAGFAISGQGPEGLLRATREKAERLLAGWAQLEEEA